MVLPFQASVELGVWIQIVNRYTLFDGLGYNTCGYFASWVVFFRARQGRAKIGAMSKMSARIIC